MQSADDIGGFVFFFHLCLLDSNDKQPNQIITRIFFLTGIQLSQNETVNGHEVQAPLPIGFTDLFCPCIHK
jgi:hypothetical protein